MASFNIVRAESICDNVECFFSNLLLYLVARWGGVGFDLSGFVGGLK